MEHEDQEDHPKFSVLYQPRRCREQSLSSHAQKVVIRLRSGAVGPVLSLRTWLMNCKFIDIQAIFEALLDCESVHMLSIGRNDALANSVELADLLACVLRRGFVWACDWGEIHFRYNVMERLLSGLSDEKHGPRSNLAFVFADVGCGISPGHVSQLKSLTRARRLLDKALPPEMIDRTHGPWLQADKVFGWVMRSENLTRCFWRPYQEGDFWRHAGFSCDKVAKPENARMKWVNPGVQPYCTRFHTGQLDAQSLEAAFPPGLEGERKSGEFLARCLHESRATDGNAGLALSTPGDLHHHRRTLRSCAAQSEQLSRRCRSRSRSSAPATPPSTFELPRRSYRRRVCRSDTFAHATSVAPRISPSTPDSLKAAPSTPPSLARQSGADEKPSRIRRVWKAGAFDSSESRAAHPHRTNRTINRHCFVHGRDARRVTKHAKRKATVTKAEVQYQLEEKLRSKARAWEAQAARQAEAKAAQQARERRDAAAAQRAAAMREEEKLRSKERAWEAQAARQAEAKAAQQARERREAAAAQRAAAMREAELRAQIEAEQAQLAKARREAAAAQRAIAMREVEKEALFLAGVDVEKSCLLALHMQPDVGTSPSQSSSSSFLKRTRRIEAPISGNL